MNTPVPLVIAAHGTRVGAGVEACTALVDRVRRLLVDVPTVAAYVELVEPSIDEALAGVLAGQTTPRAVVVPLMVGAGGHVREDIPEAIADGQRGVPDAEVAYAAHLGSDPRLRAAVRQRIASALDDWTPAETTVVLLGRGCSVPEANADHARLARLVWEEGGHARVVPAFIQVSHPSLGEALDEAYALGGRSLVVAPNFLFPGRLHAWTQQGINAWLADHPDAAVRLADVIGDCDELASVVVDRYRAAARTLDHADHPGPAPDHPHEPLDGAGAPVYLAGLALRDRAVVVVGAGRVAERRLRRLLEVGARVHVVAPEATPGVRAFADAGLVAWTPRGYAATDLDGAWYALAASDDPAVNEAVAADAEDRHTFCVRADDARGGSAFTPATENAGGLTVAVVGNRDPRRSRRVRDALVRALD